MLTKLREPFGKAGLIVAIVALIAALGGGAYAASGGLSGKQKKEVTKIAQTEAKKFAGKQGAPGANGTNGAPGAKGDAGAAGSNGTNGTNGAPGKSVEAFEVPAGGGPTAPCEGRGGAEYEVEGSGEAAEICNGKEGSPWAVNALPAGATETGAWAFNASEAASIAPAGALGNGVSHTVLVPISFSVPLAARITESSKIHFVGETGDGVNCKGSAQEPKALPGQLCIYWVEYENAEFSKVLGTDYFSAGASKAGAFIQFKEVVNGAAGAGSWAVTGG